MTNRWPRCRGATAFLALAAVLGAGCGADSSAPTDTDTDTVSASPSPSSGASPSSPAPLEITAEQLRDLPPDAGAVAALLGVEDLSSGPNDGVSQVLEGIEMTTTLDYYGYSYAMGDPNKGGDFASVGLLSMVGTQTEIEDLYDDLTHARTETPGGTGWEPVDVAGMSEASTSFAVVAQEDFVLDTTVVRRDRLLLFVTVLSSEDAPRRGVSPKFAELVLGAALA